jgi:hypothetical protein
MRTVRRRRCCPNWTRRRDGCGWLVVEHLGPASRVVPSKRWSPALPRGLGPFRWGAPTEGVDGPEGGPAAFQPALTAISLRPHRILQGDPEVPVRLLKAERRRAGPDGCELEGPARDVADPQRSHELEAGSRRRCLVCHCRSRGFFDFWPTMGFFTTASLK